MKNSGSKWTRLPILLHELVSFTTFFYSTSIFFFYDVTDNDDIDLRVTTISYSI